MQVVGIGNVTECNRSYIHLNDEGKQRSITATSNLLKIIKETASVDTEFYTRMREVLYDEYENRRAEVVQHYHCITDDMIKEAYARSYMEGSSLSCLKDTTNREFERQWGILSGIMDMAILAMDRKHEARRLLRQAEGSLTQK